MKALITLLALLALSFNSNASVVGDRWVAFEDTFIEVSEKSGVGIDILATFAGIESSFRPNAAATTSTARGLFQFTSRTWRVTIKSYGSEWELSDGVSRYNAYANTAMGAEYIKENAKVLRKRLKREPTVDELYMAHLLSPLRAAKVAKMKSSAVLADFYPTIAKANKPLFYKNGNAVTVSQFKHTIASKVAQAKEMYGTIAVASLERHIAMREQLAWEMAASSFNRIDCHESEFVRDNLERIISADLAGPVSALQTIALNAIAVLPRHPTDSVVSDGMFYYDRRRIS